MGNQKPKYIDGVGWRYETEHRMTRWPEWKDSHLPGTYMFTLKVNGGQHLLGKLEGTISAVRQWMRNHPSEVQAASNDDLYYRHALLGTAAMPFVHKAHTVQTVPHKDPATPGSATTPGSAATPGSASGLASPGSAAASPVHRRFNDVAPGSPASSAPPRPRKTHFPVAALRQPDAPHIVLSPLGEKVMEAWNRMPKVVPEIEQIALAIMPNHIHAIIALRRPLPRAIGAVLRSFMGTTTHHLHLMMAEGGVRWNPSVAKISRSATPEKPSLWEEGFCVGVCQTEEKLHTRIGYVLQNPFFAVLEKENSDMMQRVQRLTVADREYRGYGNMLLLKEPDRIQVFCHRKHPVTREPYHLTKDFHDEKSNILKAATEGAVIVTPGISPGEADIMWSVLKAGGCVINIQKDEMSDKWHPNNERRLYCSQGTLLVLAVHDLPHQVFRDQYGDVIPNDSKYVQFHLLNHIAEEICAEGIEHSCYVITPKRA